MHAWNWTYAENPEMPEWVFYTSAIYLGVVGVFGVLANSVIILAFIKNSEVSKYSTNP